MRSWMTSGISYAPPGMPTGLGSWPVSYSSRRMYAPASPAKTFSRVAPIAWSWNHMVRADCCGAWFE